MPAVFEWKHVVESADLDDLQHANNVSYLKWMQSAAVSHSSMQGWPGEAYQQLGCGWVVRSHHIEYFAQARLHDEVVVRTWVADMKKVTSLRRFHIYRASDQVVLAKAATDWAFIDYRTGMPKRVPVEVSSSFEIHVEDAS